MQKYQLNEIFRSIQGEGVWSGLPATFIRLSGCSVGCSFCDTVYTWDLQSGEEISVEELTRRVEETHRQEDIIVITGGEPALQYLPPLVEALRDLGPVHLETTGAYPISTTSIFDWLTISPKFEEGAGISFQTLRQTDEIKWLIKDETDVEALKQFLDEECCGLSLTVSVQPVSMGKEATEIAYRAALANGWHLSLQLHQLIGVK